MESRYLIAGQGYSGTFVQCMQGAGVRRVTLIGLCLALSGKVVTGRQLFESDIVILYLEELRRRGELETTLGKLSPVLGKRKIHE